MWSNSIENIRGLESCRPASDELVRAISENMTAYKNLYYYLEGTFDGCEVSHVSRASNEEADNLPISDPNACLYRQESFGKKS
jgi:hypothetical protein